jgi:hypothetical protein
LVLPVTIKKNLVTDYGAHGDGVTNNVPAFAAFTDDMVGETDDIVLTIPAGDYHMSTDQPIVLFSQATPSPGSVTDLVVSGYGVSISNGNNIGGFGIEQAAENRIATASAGAISITCLVPSDAADFASGDWCMLGAINTQLFSYPNNLAIFEYLQVASADAGTGVVTFTTPLQYGYRSTYPNYPEQVFAHEDGAATIYVLDPRWSQTVEIRGVTFEETGQIYSNALYTKYLDCTFVGEGPIPTMGKTFIAEYCQIGTGLLRAR